MRLVIAEDERCKRHREPRFVVKNGAGVCCSGDALADLCAACRSVVVSVPTLRTSAATTCPTCAARAREEEEREASRVAYLSRPAPDGYREALAARGIVEAADDDDGGDDVYSNPADGYGVALARRARQEGRGVR